MRRRWRPPGSRTSSRRDPGSDSSARRPPRKACQTVLSRWPPTSPERRAGHSLASIVTASSSLFLLRVPSCQDAGGMQAWPWSQDREQDRRGPMPVRRVDSPSPLVYFATGYTAKHRSDFNDEPLSERRRRRGGLVHTDLKDVANADPDARPDSRAFDAVDEELAHTDPRAPRQQRNRGIDLEDEFPDDERPEPVGEEQLVGAAGRCDADYPAAPAAANAIPKEISDDRASQR